MRAGGRSWALTSVCILAALAATACAATGAPPAPGAIACTESSIGATLLPPGVYTSIAATGPKTYATEAVELTNTSRVSCYLERPTLMQVSVPPSPEDVEDVSVLVPARVAVPPDMSVTLEFGVLEGCSTFEPPRWASSVMLTLPRVGTFRLDGMHLDLLCGPPLLLRFMATPSAGSLPTATGSPAASSAPSTATEGVVIGGLEACTGIFFRTPLPFAAGTIVVLKGTETITGGLPKTVVATQTLSAGSRFHFVLPGGDYVLIGHYTIPTSIAPWIQIEVTAGSTTNVDIPNRCA